MADYQSTPPPPKKLKLSDNPSPDWSDLYPELLGIVLNKLPFVDVYRCKAVCSSWCSSAKSYITSPSFTSHVDQTPWLVLPEAEDDDDEESDVKYNRFYNLSEKKVYAAKNFEDGIHGGWCIGSSLGWLMIVDEKAKLHLTNPFSSSKFELPQLNTLHELMCYDEDYFVRVMRKIFFLKAILTRNPSRSKSFGVVVLYGRIQSAIAYCRNGDSEWTKLRESSPYTDITCHNNQLFALTGRGSIEIWDIAGITPTITAKIEPHIEIEENVKRKFPREKFSSQLYLVKSEQALLLACRFTANFVDPNGKVITEGELPWDEYFNPVICPYKTMGFVVYKLDFRRQRWERVDSIGDRILFVGGNQSASKSGEEIRGCKEDSIYFTDDNWDRMDEDYMYGGHDMGCYSLKDGSIDSLYPRQPLKISPPPMFIFPTWQ